MVRRGEVFKYQTKRFRGAAAAFKGSTGTETELSEMILFQLCPLSGAFWNSGHVFAGVNCLRDCVFNLKAKIKHEEYCQHHGSNLTVTLLVSYKLYQAAFLLNSRNHLVFVPYRHLIGTYEKIKHFSN